MAKNCDLKLFCAPLDKGFSLVELLVSMTIALIALAGVFSVFSHSVQANATSLKEIKLNQELRVILDVMGRDIRRAGYWSQADGFTDNPFSTNEKEISVTNLNCITYSYDINSDNVINHNDNHGFKRVKNAIAIRKSSATCTESGGHKWEAISDLNTLEITSLHFDLKKNVCLNLTNSARSCDLTSMQGDTRPPGLSGDYIEIMPVVVITLAGKLKADPSIADFLVETIALRNTLSRKIP